MAAKVTIRGKLPIAKIAKSQEIAAALEPFADRVLDAVRRDSNEEFVKTLRKKTFVSGGRRGRISWQVGAQSQIGRRVEAKRGVFARAIAFIRG